MTPSPCPPLSDADWPEFMVDMREGFAGQLNVYRTMANHPALLRSRAALRQHLVKDSALEAARSEVVILRTGHRLGSHYEWAHHVSPARALGLPTSESVPLQRCLVVVPVAPDIFSLKGLNNVGRGLADWRRGWALREPI